VIAQQRNGNLRFEISDLKLKRGERHVRKAAIHGGVEMKVPGSQQLMVA
jgi:ribosomal protein L6P/L9E